MGQEIYEQIVSTWRFMNIGLFLNNWMKNNPDPEPFSFEYNGFVFDKVAINAFWPRKFIGINNNSYFSSHIFFSSAREIISGVYEGIDKYEFDDDEILKFKDFVISITKENYDSFDKILRLFRNVLSHNQSSDFLLKESDFVKQKKYCANKGRMAYSLHVDYSQIFGEKYPIQDKFTLELDFDKLTAGQSFFNYFSCNDIMKMTVFCGSIAEYYINERTQLYLKSITNKIHSA